MHELTSIVSNLLDGSAEQFRAGNSPEAITHRLLTEFRDLKTLAHPDVWEKVIEQSQQSDLFHVYQREPICFRAHTRPRGYSGDAALLDMVYRRDYSGVHPSEPCDLGKDLFSTIAACCAPDAVRNRAALVARDIDECVLTHGAPRLLSVACGHIEELNRTTLWSSSTNAKFTAFDHDPASLETAKIRFRSPLIEYIQGNVKSIITGSAKIGNFDFIYSTGLFDYLSDRFASRLIKSLYLLLNPGGKLIIFNFHKDMPGDAFMDTLMDWRLIYRDCDDMSRIATDAFLNQSDATFDVKADVSGHLAVLTVKRHD